MEYFNGVEKEKKLNLIKFYVIKRKFYSNRELFVKVIIVFYIWEVFSVVIDFSVFNVFYLFKDNVFCVLYLLVGVFCNFYNGGEEDYGDKSLNVIIEMKYRVY